MNDENGVDQSFLRLVAIMEALRTPGTGCPWDIEQTFETIAPYTLEESYEVVDAIQRNDMPDLRDELGDLLLQVVFHSRMAEELGHFTIGDVANAISDKMERRHPHVFGNENVENADAQTRSWEETKAQERAVKAQQWGSHTAASVLDDVPIALPALSRALKLQKRAARVGFDWANVDLVIEKHSEELAELKAELNNPDANQSRVEDEVGDLLFTCVNIARQLGIDPETALRNGNIKFETRFRKLESLLAAQGKIPQDLSLPDLEDIWVRAKSELATPPET